MEGRGLPVPIVEITQGDIHVARESTTVNLDCRVRGAFRNELEVLARFLAWLCSGWCFGEILGVLFPIEATAYLQDAKFDMSLLPTDATRWRAGARSYEQAEHPISRNYIDKILHLPFLNVYTFVFVPYVA